jgi:DNA-binding NarL/FixJ family response regulator
VVGEARDGREAVETVVRHRPDVVVMDLVMPEMDGLTAIATLKRQVPDVRFLVLSTYGDAERVLGAVRAGADGYLLKDVDARELERAIRQVHAGRPYLHAEAARRLAEVAGRPAPTTERLTRREQEILALLASGLANREIGQRLGIAEKTASVHVSNILGKLSVTSRTQAALQAAALGLVPRGDPASREGHRSHG